MTPLRTRGRKSTAPAHALCRRLDALEVRCMPATISIGDAVATEGPDVARSAGVPISALSSPINTPRGITKGPNGDYFVTSDGTNSVLRYDGATLAYLGAFVAPGSGGLANPVDLVFAQGRLLVTDGDADTVLQYDAATGASLGAFVPAGAQGIDRPTELLVHGGSLYIGAWSGDVHRYDLATGAFIDKFVQTNAGGLLSPGGLAFGPDGNFYVADFSHDHGVVLRYDGTTGAFIDQFIPSDTAGLTRPGGIRFGPDGNLYVVDFDNDRLLRFHGATGAFMDVFVAPGQQGIDAPTRFVFAGSQVLVVSRDTNSVARFEVSPWAVFNVTLSSAQSEPVTVQFATADGTASAGSDYIATAGTVTFSPGETTKTILVRVIDDALSETSEAFAVTLFDAVGATIADGQAVGTITDDDATKFFVVNDGSPDQTYRYGAPGNGQAVTALGGGNSAPRGAASTIAGDKLWVVDANKTVYVYSSAGTLLGSWAAGGLPGGAQVEGIATNGTDVWLLDNKQDKVFRYAGAASRLSGSQNAANSFALNSGNKNGKGIVTDGTSFWVVDDAATDKVFKYTLAGALLGSWTIDAANASPTGLTIDPANVSDIWIVDNGTDRVYQYTAAASRTTGSQSASATFALAVGNTNPQDIADPPVPDMLLAPSPVAIAPTLPDTRTVDFVTPVRPPAVAAVGPRRAVGPRIDLGGSSLDLADPVLHGTRIDENAAGRGRFIDPTPSDDAEIAGRGARVVTGRSDPVSVESHTMDDPIGLDDEADPVRVAL